MTCQRKNKKNWQERFTCSSTPLPPSFLWAKKKSLWMEKQCRFHDLRQQTRVPKFWGSPTGSWIFWKVYRCPFTLSHQVYGTVMVATVWLTVRNTIPRQLSILFLYNILASWCVFVCGRPSGTRATHPSLLRSPQSHIMMHVVIWELWDEPFYPSTRRSRGFIPQEKVLPYLRYLIRYGR